MGLSGWIAGLSALVLMGGSAEAGDLEPPGPPGPTMKTLDEIPPTWTQVLLADDSLFHCSSSRFKCVLPSLAQPQGAAVLDRETGLVWERTPSTSGLDWTGAQSHCNDLRVANRLGWRLPTIQELASLADPTGPSGLPNGHPFSEMSPFLGYWSATSNAAISTSAWFVVFVNLLGNVVVGSNADKSIPFIAWCVRGGQGADLQ